MSWGTFYTCFSPACSTFIFVFLFMHLLSLLVHQKSMMIIITGMGNHSYLLYKMLSIDMSPYCGIIIKKNTLDFSLSYNNLSQHIPAFFQLYQIKLFFSYVLLLTFKYGVPDPLSISFMSVQFYHLSLLLNNPDFMSVQFYHLNPLLNNPDFMSVYLNLLLNNLCCQSLFSSTCLSCIHRT